jgi:hypothetical protein
MKRTKAVAALFLAAVLVSRITGAQAVIVPSPVPAVTSGCVLQYNLAAAQFQCNALGAASQPLDDSYGLLANHADATKVLKINVAGIAAGTTRTWTAPNASLTFPTTIASLATNTFTDLQTMNGGLASTTGTFSSTLAANGGLTASTATVGSLVLPTSATSTRIVYGTSANHWGESAVLTFDGARTVKVAYNTGAGPRPSRFGQAGDYRIDVSTNLSYDGANWNLDATGSNGWNWNGSATNPFAVSYAAAGSNPRTPTDLLSLSSAGVLTVSSDVYTTAWTDYGSTSTVTGWSSFTAKIIRYKQVGKLMFVVFSLDGTSNSTAVSFTLPVYNSADVAVWVAAGHTYDNGANTASPGQIRLDASDNTVRIYKSNAGDSWTASNGKLVQGEFFFQVP